MKQKEFVRKLVSLFADKAGCGIQHGDCPCNTCFHAIDTDFRHVCWLILLSLRGDYDQEDMLKEIKKELEREQMHRSKPFPVRRGK